MNRDEVLPRLARHRRELDDYFVKSRAISGSVAHPASKL